MLDPVHDERLVGLAGTAVLTALGRAAAWPR
jgi:hypothetical protein